MPPPKSSIHQLRQLADIEPLHVAAYIEAMQSGFEREAHHR